MKFHMGSQIWVSLLVYADDVVLLSWTPTGPEALLDIHLAYYLAGTACQTHSLTVGSFKPEVVVFNGPGTGMWHVGKHVLPQSASNAWAASSLESSSMPVLALVAFAKLA